MDNPVLLNHEGDVLKTNETVYCRILHLSDLHLSINSTKDEFETFCSGTRHRSLVDETVTDLNTILKKNGLRGYLMKKPVDCLVITGDFTHRGNFSKENIQFIKDRITELYGICAKAGDWRYDGKEWNSTLPMDRLFYCAGNHDLLRDAVSYDAKTGKYIARQNIVRELAKKQAIPGKTGCLPSDNAAEFSLLTEFTFKPFYEMIESLRRGSEENQEGINFEGTVFRLKAGEHSNGPDICFAAINTALLAGNAEPADPDTLQTSWLKMHASVDVQEKCQAAKDYYEQLQKQAGRVINDNGKLCMPSKTTLNALTEEIRRSSSYIGIMLGHHNHSMLCENAATEFNRFAKQCEIGLYLCGHTHRPDHSRTSTSDLYSKANNLQIRVSSGSFFDKTDYYSSLGFSIHTISRSNINRYFFQSEYIVYSRLPETWMDITVGSMNAGNRFEMEVSKSESSAVSAPGTQQPKHGTESGSYTENRNPLNISDPNNKNEISNDQTNTPETVFMANDESFNDAKKKLESSDQKEAEEVNKKRGISEEIPNPLQFTKRTYTQLPPYTPHPGNRRNR